MPQWQIKETLVSNDTKPAEQADKTKPQAKPEKATQHPYEKYRVAHEKDGGLNIYNFREA
jgi:hypothetical protein